MKLLYGDDFKRIFADSSNVLAIDAETLYLYCLRCGGIKMFHIFNESKEARLIVESLEMVPLCHCHRPRPIRFLSGKTERDQVQQTLANVFVGLGSCRSLEDARLMIEEMASREEMRDTEQQVL